MPPASCHFRPPLSRAVPPCDPTGRPCSPDGHQRRTAQRRAPSARWALTGAHGCPLRPCARLLDSLEDLPRETWIAIGRQSTRIVPPDERAATVAARAALEAVLARRGLGAIAWYVHDAIETAAHLTPHRPCAAAGSAPRTAPGRRWRGWRPERTADADQVAAARRALGDAALALLVRPWLSPEHVRALTAPRAIIAADRAG